MITTTYGHSAAVRKALELFEDDQSTFVVLHRHLLRSVAAPMVDILLRNLDEHNKLKNGLEVQEASNSEYVFLSPGDRTTICKSFPGSLANKALAVVEALEGKVSISNSETIIDVKSVEIFMAAFRMVTEESGLPSKNLDKKLERTLLHSYRKIYILYMIDDSKFEFMPFVCLNGDISTDLGTNGYIDETLTKKLRCWRLKWIVNGRGRGCHRGGWRVRKWVERGMNVPPRVGHALTILGLQDKNAR
ncbi:hypothetical protein Fmac_006343 [Flemingia macrophylla]|uniref:E3 UFM1-protein ligase 1-like domain-containing protein n=1 Tax=Flemingia macrophylla TaxID=520843 RepID=A0ABD1NAB6_9FABA